MSTNSASPGSRNLRGRPDRVFFAFNAIASTSALAFLAYVLVLRRGGDGAALDLRFLPPVDASLNALAAAFLSVGFFAIRRNNPRLHKFCMVAAFVASSLFLVCYLAYHYTHGDTRYAGSGPLKIAYLIILASHIVLSMSVLPLALTSFYFALRGEFQRHKRVAKITLPIWLYVSVTGVVIYVMLRGSPPAVP
jgi:putative membrane protein